MWDQLQLHVITVLTRVTLVSRDETEASICYIACIDLKQKPIKQQSYIYFVSIASSFQVPKLIP